MTGLINNDDFNNSFEEIRQLAQLGQQQRQAIKRNRHEVHNCPDGTRIEVWEELTVLNEVTTFGRRLNG